MADDDKSVKVWLITGTSSGFGKRLVSAALARGDRVIATARDLEKLKELKPSTHLQLLQLDVDEGAESIKTKIDKAVTIWGRIDVVVNNAAYGLKAVVEEAGSKGFHKQFQTNLYGTLDVTVAVLPHMRERKSGTVVMIGSRSAWKPEVPGLGLYAASKAAMHAFSETLALELAPFSIRVLIVEPGAFRTETINSFPYYTENKIDEWHELRTKSDAHFAAVDGTQKGDPVKAMEAVADVVRGEGKAQGRPWPLYLVLGEDADHDIRKKCQRMLDTLDQWKDVTLAVNFDE